MRIIVYTSPNSPTIERDEFYKLDIQQLDFLCANFSRLFGDHRTCKSFLIFYPDYFTVNTVGNIFCDFHYVGPIYDDQDYQFWIKTFRYHYNMLDHVLINIINSDQYLQDNPKSNDFECIDPCWCNELCHQCYSNGTH